MSDLATVLPLRDPAEAKPEPRVLVATPGRGDRIFYGVTSLSGITVLAIMVGVGGFLAYEALDAFKARGLDYLTTSEWQPDTGTFGIAAVIGFTIAIAAVAVAIAVPVSLGTALFITEIAPAWMRSTLIAGVDLMAAVPSVVYGLWG